MKELGIGHSHAKIILIGEHSVVYGQPAIALPLPDVKMTATITPATNGHTIASEYFTGAISDLPDKMSGVQKLVQALIERFHGQNDPWKLTIESDLPAERGMGSSAATAVAIVRAFFDYYEAALDRGLLLQLADIEEEITHRSPSGLDAATVSSKQPLFFIKGQAGTPFQMHLTGTMVIADTGIKGATKEAIEAVQEQLRDNHQSTVAHIDHLGKLSTACKEFLTNNELMKLGTSLNAAQADLAELNVSSPELDHLIQVAREHGAIGAKLTGGGRGGCMFAITQTALDARKIATVLTNHGAKQVWLQPLEESEAGKA